MKFISMCIGMGAAMLLTACGSHQLPFSKPPDLPLQSPRHASQAPIIDLDGVMHVGRRGRRARRSSAADRFSRRHDLVLRLRGGMG